MYRFILSGEVVPKKNSKNIYVNKKTNRPFISTSERFKDWHEQAKLQIMTQKKQYGEFEPVEKATIMLEFYHADKRRRDSDNGTSSVFDLLKDCGIIKDDSWLNIPIHTVYNYQTDKSNGSFCIVTIDQIK